MILPQRYEVTEKNKNRLKLTNFYCMVFAQMGDKITASEDAGCNSFRNGNQDVRLARVPGRAPDVIAARTGIR